MAQTKLEPVTFLSESTTLSIQPLSSSFIMRNSYMKRKPVNLAVTGSYNHVILLIIPEIVNEKHFTMPKLLIILSFLQPC